MQKYIFSLTISLVLFFSQSILAQVNMELFKNIKTRNIGPAGMSGRVTCIDVVEKNKDIMYVGSASGGVWKSINGGHTWKPIFENEKTASIGAIAIYQNNPTTIYVGSGEGNPRNSHNSGYGMYKSIDGGATWQHIGLEKTRQIHRVIVHPNNANVVWVATMGSAWAPNKQRGVYKTTDGGKTWVKVLYVNDLSGVADMVIDPSNPDKLLVAFWEHRRYPWFFQSGGAGSGIYLSHDGGEEWKKLTPQENGIPQGDLGRIGLAFAPSNTQYIYAFIEAQYNAIWRSTDGGDQWERMSEKNGKHIGNRPFYYADLYVDTKNENRIYSIATEINTSQDGGKNWKVFAAHNKIHTDHHAWWADKENPQSLIVGNDGGLMMTKDRGENWFFVENLPLAQFYHIRIDKQIPYNIYGGLQDNGSWKGPGFVWFQGGIRNLYWQRIGVGDGFDVIPDPIKTEYGYSTQQAGDLLRFHSPTGQLLRIKPQIDNEYLRFNWNPGMAIDPFDKKTIFYGSQYLLSSSDYGGSWGKISPDLTTNNPKKQKFLQSGGLTFDVTGAEFFTTIISIAPSEIEKGRIWVGTDDGKVQLTKDGGKTWKDISGNIPSIAKDSWVTQIQPSHFVPTEAFVVFDDHRRNNWTPLIYHVKEDGKVWDRLVDEKDVWGFALCFLQDKKNPKLLFCGTEFGLYISFDGGKKWQQWKAGYPTVPTQDLVIDTRFDDLIIGTFGRAIWIIDDVSFLREIAKQGIEKIYQHTLFTFPPKDTYSPIIGESWGYRKGKIGDVLFQGENKPIGALFTYYLKKEEKDSVQIAIYDNQDMLIRTLYQKAEKGFNRVVWDLKRDPIHTISYKLSSTIPLKNIRKGLKASPGAYKVIFQYGEERDTTKLNLLPDPRVEVKMKDIKEKDKFIKQVYQQAQKAVQVSDSLVYWKKNLKIMSNKLKTDERYKLLKQRSDALIEDIKNLQESVMHPENIKGIYGRNNKLVYQSNRLYYYLDDVINPVTLNHKKQFDKVEKWIEKFSNDFETFKKNHFLPFKKDILKSGVSILD